MENLIWELKFDNPTYTTIFNFMKIHASRYLHNSVEDLFIPHVLFSFEHFYSLHVLLSIHLIPWIIRVLNNQSVNPRSEITTMILVSQVRYSNTIFWIKFQDF